MDLLGALTEYGLFAVPPLILLSGTGLPVSEDGVLLAAGWLSAADPWLALAVAWPSVLLSDQIMFSLARAGRRSERIREGRVARAAAVLARWGMPAVFVARFVVGLRAPVFLAVGLGGLSRAKFLLADALAAALSVPLMVWLGARYGPELEEHIAPYAPWVAGAVVLALLVSMAVRLVRGRRRGVD